jgi:hypothetical protein
VTVAIEQATAERVRKAVLALANRAGADPAEKTMFGSLCFTVDGRICCAVNPRGGLLVRVGRDGMDRALTDANVYPMEMAGRRMSGFVLVAPEGFATAASLRKWATCGIAAASRAGG